MSQVVNEIILENEWRSTELTKLKTNPFSVSEALWYRMSIPMLYAHWEGYVQSALKTVLNHLNDKNIAFENAKTNICVLSLGEAYRSLSGKQSFQQRIEFTDRYKALCNASLTFSRKIDTKSNLKSEVFNELCDSFGFNKNQFADKLFSIDKLVHIRNAIAHGENSTAISIDQFDNYLKSYYDAVDMLLNEIELFITEKKYYKEVS